jgi:hypothetical protein
MEKGNPVVKITHTLSYDEKNDNYRSTITITEYKVKRLSDKTIDVCDGFNTTRIKADVIGTTSINDKMHQRVELISTVGWTVPAYTDAITTQLKELALKTLTKKIHHLAKVLAASQKIQDPTIKSRPYGE